MQLAEAEANEPPSMNNQQHVELQGPQPVAQVVISIDCVIRSSQLTGWTGESTESSWDSVQLRLHYTGSSYRNLLAAMSLSLLF